MTERPGEILPFPSATGETGTPVIKKGIDTKSAIRRRTANLSSGGGDGGDISGRISSLESHVNELKINLSSIHTDVTWIKRVGAGVILIMISFGAWTALEIVGAEKKQLEYEKQQSEKDNEINLKLQRVLDSLPPRH